MIHGMITRETPGVSHVIMPGARLLVVEAGALEAVECRLLTATPRLARPARDGR